MDYPTEKQRFNSECQQKRCKICYEEQLPLISLCECSGSIGFVHEQCILDWITKKLQTSANIQIPVCQICKAQYSARLKVGTRKISYPLLLQKVKAMKTIQVIVTIFFFISTLYAFYLLGSTLTNIMSVCLANIFSIVLSGVTFPFTFINRAYKHFKKRRRLVQQSIIQIVEVTLLPKVNLN